MAVPPDFTAGQVLTAAQMNAVGLWLVKSQTIGAAVSSVAVTDAFSADYDAYKIVISGGAGSTDANLLLTFGASTASYYWGQTGITYAGSSIGSNGNNTTSIRAGFGTTDSLQLCIDVNQPFLAKFTIVYATHVSQIAAGGGSVVGGYHAVASSYTDFTITPSGGTMTGGEIRVYGYRT